MGGAESSLVDANILVYAASPTAVQHRASRALLESELRLCVASQVFAEFYAVVTNPRRVTVPFTPTEARAFINELAQRMEILPVSAAVVNRWTELAERHSVNGANVFDLQLAATMIESGVRRIYTYNRADFEALTELDVLTPNEQIQR
jgi:toxin-antitoxin system PIN domain toxin